jgi:glycosyltransferase involved in cell wall biosynthesis
MIRANFFEDWYAKWAYESQEERMAKPVFSIVIPTYNRHDLVSYAIQSVLWQTFDDYEIIVCDNFSTDNTATVVGQFKDPRVKYIRTPQHFVIADNFEFSRKHAGGKLVLMMSDDDAFVPTALETFYEEYRRHEAEFIFSQIAEYRDNGFPGLERNILDCLPFSGVSRIIQADELLNPLFCFKYLTFSMHPSGFVFSSTLANTVANRTGRFFQTNGIEFFAWPVAAVLSNKIVYIESPLVICGRTKKSWGSNLVYSNPGRNKIKKFIDDVEKIPKCAPFTNFTGCNLIAEGILTAKKLYPKEFERYKFDEAQYIMRTMEELNERKRLGVDVSSEIAEVKNYLIKNPALMNEISRRAQLLGEERKKTIWRRVRSKIGDLGVRQIKERIRIPIKVRKITTAGAHKIKRGEVNTGLKISGVDFGFHDILGCAKFLNYIVTENNKVLNLN